MASATGLVNTHDVFFQRQLQQQQALQLQLLQPPSELGAFAGQPISSGSLHGFDQQVRHQLSGCEQCSCVVLWWGFFLRFAYSWLMQSKRRMSSYVLSYPTG